MPRAHLTRIESAARAWLPGLLLAAIVLRIFSPVVGFSFLHYDDLANFHDNPLVSEPTWWRIVRTWMGPHLGIYVPLTTTLWAGLAATTQFLTGGRFPNGLDSSAFHALNLALHLGCVWLVFRLLTRATGSAWAAAAGAGIWAWHPLTVESVAWASETKGLWSAWWGLVCLGQYQRAWGAAGDFQRGSPCEVAVSRRRLAGAGLAYLLCLLAKPSGLAILPMLALWHVLWLGSRYRVLVCWLALAAAPTVAVAALASGEQSDSYPSLLVGPMERPLVALDSWGFYLRKLIWPIGLGPDYGRMPQVVVDLPHALVALATLAGVFAAAAYGVGVRKAMLACGWFLLPMLPVVGFLSFRFQEYSTVADRYAYLGLLGPAWLLATWLSGPQRTRLRWAVALPILALLAGLTTRQVRVWQNEWTLGEHTLAVNPASVLGPTMLAFAEQDAWRSSRQSDERHRAQELRQWQQAAAVRPPRPIALYNLGVAYAERDDWERAEQNLREAIRLFPGFAGARSTLADVFIRQGKHESAIGVWRGLVADGLASSENRTSLAWAYWNRDQLAEARSACLAGLDLDPTSDGLQQVLGWIDEYQSLLTIEEKTEQDWLDLAFLHGLRGQPFAEAAAIRAGLGVYPESHRLQERLRFVESIKSSP